MNPKNSVLNELRQQQELFDVLIRVENREFHAHKLTLSICSPYFRALFTRWSTPDCRVFDVNDGSPQTMELIIEYAYTDCLTVTDENVVDLFKAADRLNITGIIQVCRKHFEQHLSPHNCVGIWRFADMYSQPELKHQAFLFMLTRFEEVVATSDKFRDLSVQELVKILESDQLNVREERIVYEAILHWIDFAPEERQQHLSHLLSKVRLTQISEEYIRQCVLENPLVKTKYISQRILQHALRVIRQLKRNPFSNVPLWTLVARPRLPSATLLAFGGQENSLLDGTTNTIQAYNSRADRWINVSNDNGVPRSFHDSVFLNGFVYCVGGSVNMQQLSSVHRFDPETHAWQEVAPMHSRRSYLSVTVLDGCIYALGGFDGHSQLATAEVYRPETNQWKEIKPMAEKRSQAGCVALNGKVYVFGGFNGRQYLSSAECYNPHAERWTVIASMDKSRCGLRVAVCANKIYAVGGYSGRTHMTSVESYEPGGNTWHSEAPMLKSRTNFGISVMDDHIFVVGGYNESGVLSSVERYDDETHRWSNVCDLGICRDGLSCCVVQGLNNMTDYAIPCYVPHW